MYEKTIVRQVGHLQELRWIIACISIIIELHLKLIHLLHYVLWSLYIASTFTCKLLICERYFCCQYFMNQHYVHLENIHSIL